MTFLCEKINLLRNIIEMLNFYIINSETEKFSQSISLFLVNIIHTSFKTFII